ncbi:MAG TPA: SMP-30/gluconolactonase/LRE family protein [Tepidisphaeraceae bacterium]|jgi:sugar lactone lactonase YvrE/enterochelin esterase-like enzyme|nr:SMP-30/gluconolactonase/LRE family protein [Tepidisphaeraceae bacterium]
MRSPTSLTLRAFFAIALVACGARIARADEYQYGPDSEVHDVPHGVVTKHEIVSGKAYPGVHHDYWLYVPAQYDGKTPAAVMVFQDGSGFQKPDGAFRVPVVFDNLIAKKQMPVTIAIMIDPGNLPALEAPNQKSRGERSYQYDTPTDRYARFLIEEVLPKVGQEYKLTDDPNLRAICGTSSGGICAFTVCWERPDAFRRVLSSIGSFTNLRGGNQYPDLIRKTEPKPIRVFLQDGEQDLNNFAGSWWIANQDMAAALEFAGYDVRFEKGTTSHDSRQSGPLFPEALKWLWRGDSKPIEKPAGTRQPVQDILIPGEEWQVVAEGYKFTEGATADPEGNVYFTDIPNDRIYRIGPDGEASELAENTNGANGLKIGPDGRLYACQGKAGRIVAYDLKTAKEEVIADGIQECNDLAINHAGGIYVTAPPAKGVSTPGRLWYIAPGHEKKLVDETIAFPNGVGFTPDQSQLVVDDTRGVNFYLFQVAPDGSLKHKEPYYSAQIPAMQKDSGADGLCMDGKGRLYVTTHLGLQVFDEGGRVVAIISKPQDAKVRNAWLSNVTFAGPGLNTLYITCGDKVYKRKTKAAGVGSRQKF